MTHLGAEAGMPSLVSGTDWPLGAQPKGTPFPITCNQELG